MSPLSITQAQCTHLLVDAGHISVESNLADKNAVKEIQMKRNQTYTDDDFAKLEALMYDKLSVKLHAAQVRRSTFQPLTHHDFVPIVCSWQ
jgi:vacuolar protein sorting-associated protein 13A/C